MSEKGRREMRDPLNPDTKPAIFSPQHFPPSPSVIHNGSPLNDRTAGKAAPLTLKELRIGAGESHRRSPRGWLSLSRLPSRTTHQKL